MFTAPQESMIKLFVSSVTGYAAPSCLQGTGHVEHGTHCPSLSFPLGRQEWWFSLPLRKGMDLLIYGLRALRWESSQQRFCKNTGICLPTLFAFDLLFWCKAAVWLRCYLPLPNHALGMYNISHTATYYPRPQSPPATPHTSTGGGGKKVKISSRKLRHAPGVRLCFSKLSSLLLMMFAE